MRILFFLSDTMWRHTLPEGFIEAGHEVEITDTLDEKIIKNKILQFNPDFSMSLGWGHEQITKNQLIIRRCVKTSKVPHIYWSIEDPAFTFSFSLPLIQRVQPDFVFSICPYTVDFYRKIGIKSAYMDFGFSHKIHKPVNYDKAYDSSISLVANAYPNVLKNHPKHYRHTSIKTLIIPLLKNNMRIDFWGKDWDKMDSYLDFHIPKEWLHGYLYYKDANKVYCSSKIILGLQNYPNQLTQRTYEILASGGFLLTSNTPAVNRLFKSDEHLITSSSVEDTVALVNYYLENSDERQKIAGYGKTALSGCSYKDKADYIIETLKKYRII
ncbi:glycosyltransferase [Clostridium thailandense]|uniref:CgeB family protein n=1 Tax=Clostridium thailandense TaxID=2794346 RepID=UPI003988CC80